MPESIGNRNYKYKDLSNEKEFLKNTAATIVNRFGDSIDAIAFTWLVYAVSGSAALSAVTFGVNTLVSVLLLPFTGAFITNMNKKVLLVLTDLGRGALVATTAVLYLLGLAQPWMLILFTALMSTLEAFRMPTGMAVLPDILPKEKYALGTSLSAMLSRIMELAGTGAAGVVIAWLGIGGALLIDVATFLISAAILSTLRLPKREKSEIQNPFTEFADNMKGGLKYIYTNKLILALGIAACFINFSVVPLNALQAVYVTEGLRLGPEALSVMGIAMTLGMALGALIFPKIRVKEGRFYILFTALLISVSCYLGLSGVTFITSEALRWISFGGVMFFMGFFIGIVNACASVAMMERVDRNYLARISGITNSMFMAATPLGSFVAAFGARFLPVTVLFFVYGIFSVIVTLSLLAVKPLRAL